MENKKITIVAVVFALLFVVKANAQCRPEMPEGMVSFEEQIEKVLDNLSDSQIDALQKLSKENKKYLETFRKEMKVLEDSIDMLMKRKGNHSKQLYPLLERRAKLALEKDKKLYLSKVKIDGILTDEQRATIDKFFNEQRKQHKGIPMPPNGDKFR